jgi:hypothetical protein
LRKLRKKCFGTPPHNSTGPLSKRAPSTRRSGRVHWCCYGHRGCAPICHNRDRRRADRICPTYLVLMGSDEHWSSSQANDSKCFECEQRRGTAAILAWILSGVARCCRSALPLIAAWLRRLPHRIHRRFIYRVQYCHNSENRVNRVGQLNGRGRLLRGFSQDPHIIGPAFLDRGSDYGAWRILRRTAKSCPSSSP